MIPPMIYRIINPDLGGFAPEGAYMMLCQKILPAGLIGLVLAGMISATSSKANTTINLAATVFSTDLYRNLIRPTASEKELILIARLFTVLFGAGTVIVAIFIPYIGGIVDFVLSIASIAGGALFAPIIWSLFSKRQTSSSVITTTLITLSVNLFLKIAAPMLFALKLSRTYETVIGQLTPLLILFLFERYYASKGFISPRANVFEDVIQLDSIKQDEAFYESDTQNRFGIKVISLSMSFVGIGIIVLGAVSDNSSKVVNIVGSIILLAAFLIWRASNREKNTRQESSFIEV